MHVELLTYTPEAQVLVACAAKLCYSASDIDSLMQKQTPEAVERFLDKLASMGHESPLEHAYFTFGIEGVSRALLAQITRHRIVSFRVQSQRYVKSDCIPRVCAQSFGSFISKFQTRSTSNICARSGTLLF